MGSSRRHMKTVRLRLPLQRRQLKQRWLPLSLTKPPRRDREILKYFRRRMKLSHTIKERKLISCLWNSSILPPEIRLINKSWNGSHSSLVGIEKKIFSPSSKYFFHFPENYFPLAGTKKTEIGKVSFSPSTHRRCVWYFVSCYTYIYDNEIQLLVFLLSSKSVSRVRREKQLTAAAPPKIKAIEREGNNSQDKTRLTWSSRKWKSIRVSLSTRLCSRSRKLDSHVVLTEKGPEK